MQRTCYIILTAKTFSVGWTMQYTTDTHILENSILVQVRCTLSCHALYYYNMSHYAVGCALIKLQYTFNFKWSHQKHICLGLFTGILCGVIKSCNISSLSSGSKFIQIAYHALHKGQTIMVSKPCTGFQVEITVIMV